MTAHSIDHYLGETSGSGSIKVPDVSQASYGQILAVTGGLALAVGLGVFFLSKGTERRSNPVEPGFHGMSQFGEVPLGSRIRFDERDYVKTAPGRARLSYIGEKELREERRFPPGMDVFVIYVASPQWQAHYKELARVERERKKASAPRRSKVESIVGYDSEPPKGLFR